MKFVDRIVKFEKLQGPKSQKSLLVKYKKVKLLIVNTHVNVRVSMVSVSQGEHDLSWLYTIRKTSTPYLPVYELDVGQFST
jgi:hypothetical protein